MTPEAGARLFGLAGRLDDPIVVAIGVGAAGALAIGGAVTLALSARAWHADTNRELRRRWITWAILAPIEFACVVLGAVPTAIGVMILSALCYREFARATGVFREPLISLVFLGAIVTAAFGAVDNRFAMFTAVAPCAAVLIAAVCLARDDPRGYLQRVALGVVGVVLIGLGPAYLSMLTIDDHAAPLLLMLLGAVALGDVGAFTVGKLLRGPKLAPHVSPNKTISGSLGGLAVTVTFVALVAHEIYHGSAFDRAPLLIGLGLVVAVAGQLGDLVLSAIKRDLGLKDFGTTLPGHGGLLDRFDSIILTAPSAFYYVAYFHGVGIGSEIRVLTG
ncbi:MAG: phosphatidate cytidylyltransferase [Phycisphaerales bacterium]